MDIKPKSNIETIYRRIKFLIDEVNSNNPEYDMSVTNTMRLISNYTTVGLPKLTSKGVKKLNKKISRNANELRLEMSFDDFHKNTTNEHQFPLFDLWNWMIENKKDLTNEIVLKKFEQYPFITITNEENSKLNKLKSINLSPEERYKMVNIEVIDIED